MDTGTLIALFDQSRIGQQLGRAAGAVERAFAASRLRVTLTTIDRWRSLAHAEQLRLSGIALVTASLVHVALMVIRSTAPGWRWLVIPGICAAQGAVLLVMSKAPRHE